MPAVWAYSVLCRFLGNLEDEAPLLPYLAGLPLHQKFNELLSCLYLPGSGMNVGCPLPTHLTKTPFPSSIRSSFLPVHRPTRKTVSFG